MCTNGWDHVLFLLLPCIYCFSETWIKHGGSLLSVPGYQAFYSPFILCDKMGGDKVLPDSCLFVPEMFSPHYPPLCKEIEKSCTSLNVACCVSSVDILR